MNSFEVEGELQCHWTVGSMVLCNHIISFAALLVMSSQKMGCLCLTVGKMVGQRSRVKRVATRMPLSIWMYEQCLWQRAPQSVSSSIRTSFFFYVDWSIPRLISSKWNQSLETSRPVFFPGVTSLAKVLSWRALWWWWGGGAADISCRWDLWGQSWRFSS